MDTVLSFPIPPGFRPLGKVIALYLRKKADLAPMC